MAGGLLEDSGRCMRSGQRGGQREERTATRGIIKRIDRGHREGHEEWTARRTTGGASSYKFFEEEAI